MTKLEELKAAADAATLEQAARRHSAHAAAAAAANARSAYDADATTANANAVADATAANAAAWSDYDAAYDVSCDTWATYFAELNKQENSDEINN